MMQALKARNEKRSRYCLDNIDTSPYSHMDRDALKAEVDKRCMETIGTNEQVRRDIVVEDRWRECATTPLQTDEEKNWGV